MLAPPLAVFLILVAVGIIDRVKVVQEMSDVEALSNLAVRIGDLVHQLQKERGMSAGYIGSGGSKFAPILKAQRTVTDAKRNALARYELSSAHGKVGGRLQQSLAPLQKLSETRQGIDALKITVAATLGYYSQVNTRLLAVIGELSTLTHAEGVAARILAYVSLLQAKEDAGLERAVLANTFGSKRFAVGARDKLASLVAAEEIYTRIFVSFATDGQRQLYTSTMRGEFVDETARIRTLAFAKADSGNFGVDPLHWWRVQTGKINLMKAVEDKLSADLRDSAERGRRSARNTAGIFAVLALGIFGLVLLLTRQVARPMTVALSELATVSRKLGAGELTARVDIDSQDEIGHVGRVFNRMAEDLLRAHDALEGERVRAEAANVAKGDFLANMSHEFRTPMNAVLGMTNLLLDTTLTEEQSEYAETVHRCGNDLLTLINDILDFAKIEAGQLNIEIIDFDLRITVEAIFDLLALRGQEKGLEVICVIEPDVPSRLRGDPGRLRQILTNLVGNAIKFTSTGEVSLWVKVLEDEDQSVTLSFAVRDTGIGIPRDRVAQLFSRFTQADTSTTRKYGGTGLGLAISQQLTSLMGGDMFVESVEGEGATFSFSLGFPRQPAQLGGTRERTISSVAGKRILTVDDNATNRRLLCLLLESWQCVHEEFEHGETAIERLREAAAEGKPFDLALLDMQMPDLHGEELGRQICQDSKLSDTQLVMIASVGLRGDASRCEEIGFAAYLTKPIKESRLRRCLVEVLSRKRKPSSAKMPIITKHVLAETDTSGRRILLVDDVATNRRLAAILLEKIGHRVDIAKDGQDAVQILAERAYDLVFMDCQMPVMDGYAATRAIRDPSSQVLNRDVPVVAMTGHAGNGEREKCLEAGMNDHIEKPISRQKLESMLKKFLSEAADPEEVALKVSS